MVSNIIYLLATGFLLNRSIVEFHKDELSSYFSLIGSSLFFIKGSKRFYFLSY